MLASSLTSRSIMTMRESVTKPLSSKEASDCRDALVKVKKLIDSHKPTYALFHVSTKTGVLLRVSPCSMGVFPAPAQGSGSVIVIL